MDYGAPEKIPEKGAFSNARSWYFGRYTPLGWVETILKAIAMFISFLAPTLLISRGGPVQGLTWPMIILSSLQTLGLFAAIYDRILEKEVTAFVFLLPNIVSHIVVVTVLVAANAMTRELLIYWILFAIADSVKVYYIWTHPELKVRDVPRSTLYYLTFFYIITYILNILLGFARGIPTRTV